MNTTNNYQSLFSYMHQDHGLLLLEDEMNQIINLCRDIIEQEKPLNQSVPDNVILKYERIEKGKLKSEIEELKSILSTYETLTHEERTRFKREIYIAELFQENKNLQKKLNTRNKDFEKLLCDKLKYERMYNQAKYWMPSAMIESDNVELSTKTLTQ